MDFQSVIFRTDRKLAVGSWQLAVIMPGLLIEPKLVAVAILLGDWRAKNYHWRVCSPCNRLRSNMMMDADLRTDLPT